MVKDNLEWKLYGLEIDDYSEELGIFFEHEGYPINRVKPTDNPFLFKNKRSISKLIRKSIDIKEGERVLALYGNNRLHHFTYGLCKLADKLNKEYCYIHIDRHHDWWRKKASDLDCGNFLEKIYKDTNVKKKINNLMFIGNHYYELLDMVPESQKDELRSRCLFTSHIYDYKNKQYKPGWLKVVEKMLDNSHEKVYVSMDLDVLHGDDFLTCYEPGILRSVQLMQILTLIKEKKKIIGADVVGYVGRNPVIELQIYKKIVNTLLQ
ncbi:MAG: arginase family protein [Nanoarchaeota archaeon]|nr:arginase family protein [Nanoarchaeota archaeon]MBU4242095.1 arginase family protein [Nanoarchaeota archaeon]MBU4352546.1 arginase family protein [Nanoarchaeota archaeon]